MSHVNDGQKKAMKDIMAAMDRAIGQSPASPVGTGTSSAYDHGSDDAKKAAMGDIMRAFRSATDHVRNGAQENEALMEALQTERTDVGVRISEWQIVISEHVGRAGKFYAVHRDDIVIASDLRLYEAALLLTRELNKGSSITSSKVRQILHLEEEFSKNLDDAARFAKVVKTSTGQKKLIAEARLSDSKAKAISAKEKIKAIG